MIHLIHELSGINDCCVVFAHENVVPFFFDCQLHARNVAHAASNGAVRVPNGRKALRLKSKSKVAKLRFKMCATIHARIQIDEDHIGYIVKIAEPFCYYTYIKCVYIKYNYIKCVYIYFIYVAYCPLPLKFYPPRIWFLYLFFLVKS